MPCHIEALEESTMCWMMGVVAGYEIVFLKYLGVMWYL